MGIDERKERERLEMRQRILQAALGLFVKDGIESTSMRGIAKAIEYSPGTLYLYFKDKEELLNALFQEIFTDFGHVLSQDRALTDPMERMMATGYRYVEFAMKNPVRYELMFMMRHKAMTNPFNCEVPNSDFDLFKEPSFQHLIGTVQGLHDAGYELKSDIPSTAMMAWIGVHGLVSLYMRGFMNMPAQAQLHLINNQLKLVPETLLKNPPRVTYPNWLFSTLPQP